MRELKRQIARARLRAMGVGNPNRKMSVKQDGVPLWRRVLDGELGKQAAAAQRSGEVFKNRKIRRIEHE